MDPATLFNAADVGGMDTAPVLGESSAVTSSYQLQWHELVLNIILSPVQAIAFALLALLAFSLILLTAQTPFTAGWARSS